MNSENLCENENDHKKIWNSMILLSHPPQRKWICSKCGKTGTEYIGTSSEPKPTYHEVYEKFHSNKVRKNE